MQKALFPLVLAWMLTITPALAQSPTPVGYRDPGTATLLSVVLPGAGHLYAGETGKGAALLGAGLGGLVLGIAMTTSNEAATCVGAYSCEDNTDHTPAVLGYVACFGSWLYGVVDAVDSARRMNARRGLARVLEGVTPLVVPNRGATDVGFSVRF